MDEGAQADLHSCSRVCALGEEAGQAVLSKAPVTGLLCILAQGQGWHQGTQATSREPCPRPTGESDLSRREGLEQTDWWCDQHGA